MTTGERLDTGAGRLRAICLVLPKTSEKACGDPTFRVRDRISAIPKRGDGRFALWCKAPPGSRGIRVGVDPERFFVPPYVGHEGWSGMRLDREPDWMDIAAIVARSARMTAPKRTAAALPERRAGDTGGDAFPPGRD